jgi:hypothetical protein
MSEGLPRGSSSSSLLSTGEQFTGAIDQGPDALAAKHKPAMRTLLTREFQTVDPVSLCAA